MIKQIKPDGFGNTIITLEIPSKDMDDILKKLLEAKDLIKEYKKLVLKEMLETEDLFKSR